MADNKSVYLSIVIPAYNEGKKITKDLEAAYSYLKHKKIDGEIIVVDDGSADNTCEAVKSKHKEIPCLKLVTSEKNHGKGHALREGIAVSVGEYVVFADAGLCVPYKYIDFGLMILELGESDIAHGSRKYGNSKIVRSQPRYRQIGSSVFAFVVKVFGVPLFITDTQCGFKVYRGDVARKLYKACSIDGFMIDIETILRAKKMGFTIMEFPVLWSNDSDTSYDPIWGTLRNLKELVKIRLSV